MHTPSEMLGAGPELAARESGARAHSPVRERVVEGEVAYDLFCFL